MGDALAAIAGAPQAANNAQSYYQAAMQNDINAAGSPAAADFIKLQNRALQGQFNQEDSAMNANLAAQGITNSGAGRSAFGNLAAQQSGQIAAADAPLYQSAINNYDAINAAMPGAQLEAYQQAQDAFYNMLGAAGAAAAGIPGLGGSSGGGEGYGPAGAGYGSGGTGYYAPGDPSGVSNTPYIP